jgi:tetratricopeptide (TPR) repeat protein
MNYFGRVSFACVAVGLAAFAAAADKYWDYSYHDIRVVSGGSGDHAKLIAHNLHRVDAAMSAILGVPQADWRPKTTVYAVPARVYTLIRGFDDSSAAVALPEAFQNTILMNRDSTFDHAFFGAYAGYASALLSGGFSFRYPTWFIAGLSEVMATSKVDGKGVVIGGFERGRVQSLMISAWIPVKALLEIHEGDPQLKNASFKYMYSAECWFLVHQIIVEQQYRKNFFDYFSHLDDGEDPDKAFGESFGVDYAEIDKMMHAALDSQKVKIINVSVRDDTDPVEATLLKDAQVNGLFARVASDHGSNFAYASQLANQALAADPNDDDALIALADVAIRQHDYRQALTYADRLCQRDPPSRTSAPACGVLFAQLTYHAREHADLGSDAPALAGRAATYFQSAITHDPDDVASWSGFADLLMTTHDKERGTVLLPALKHAWSSHMDNDQLARGAAGLCAMSGDYDCAYKFATVWRKHALNSTSRANADVYIERMKGFSERRALMASPTTDASPGSPAPSATKVP